MFYSGNARGWVAVLLASTFGVSEIHAALLGLYPFSSDTTAVSLGANVSGFSVFNDNSAGGVTGGVNTTAPGFYHTSTSWNTTFNRYVQFTVTPSSGSYIIPENVVMSVRQNDANSATMMKVEVFFGTTFLDSGTATLSPGQSGGGPFSTLTFNFNAANFTAAFAGPLAFRIEAMVNDGGNNYLDFDSVSLNGIVVPENANSALVIFGLMFGTARLLRLKVARKRSQKNLRIFRAFELS